MTTKMENLSGLLPLGRAVLVEPYEPERAKSMIALPDSVQASERVLDTRVRVVAVGPQCWPDEPQRAYPGNVVLVAKMSGFVAKGPQDGKMYRFVNDRDVFAQVTWEGVVAS
jgi:co-chaperonin GroES (HSP10)